MKTLKMIFAAACLIVGMNIPSAHAYVSYASRASFDAAFPTPITENWDSYAHGTVVLNGASLNGITYSSSSGDAVVTSADGFLTTTGAGSLGRTPFNFFGSGDSITFTFTNPLTAFGIDINTFASGPGDYIATLSNGDVIGSVYDPFPGYSTGEFLGFSTSAFTSLTLSTASGYAYTLDSLRAVEGDRPSAVVPEPAPLALFAVGLLGIIFFNFRRQLGVN